MNSFLSKLCHIIEHCTAMKEEFYEVKFLNLINSPRKSLIIKWNVMLSQNTTPLKVKKEEEK